MDSCLQAASLLHDVLRARDVDPRAVCELARQGFVAADYRVRGGRRFGTYHKLRWRENRRQRVVYLGCDPELAERVKQALETLQRARRLRSELSRLLCAARRQLRQIRRLLEPRAREAGYTLHGYRIRRIVTALGPETSGGGSSLPGGPTARLPQS